MIILYPNELNALCGVSEINVSFGRMQLCKMSLPSI